MVLDMSRLTHLWRSEPIAVIYVVATAVWTAVEAWNGGVGWEHALESAYVAAGAALARFTVYSPATVAELTK